MQQVLLLLRITHHVQNITNLSRRPILPLLQVSQRASIWQEVPSTFAGNHLQVKPADTTVDRSCDEVRRQINRLIDCREFTIKSFCRKIGVSRMSYYRFMRQNGAWKGEKGDTFPSALWYLQQREREGIELPKKKTGHKQKEGKQKAFESDVELNGEKEDEVPVFDTCDVIRRKINMYLRRPSNTQNSLVKALSSQFYHTPTAIAVSHLEKFRNARGPNVGNTNPVFYAAYVFFEKQRLRSKKEKSKIRLEMEEVYREVGGVNVKVPTDKYGAWIGKQERDAHVQIDKLGLVDVFSRRGGGAISYGPRGRPIPPWQQQKLFVYD